MSLPRQWLAGLLALLVTLGVGLRFHDLGEKSLWADELFTLAIAKYYPLLPEEGQPLYRRISLLQIGDGDTFLTAKASEQSPPLNDLLEKATVQWLGTTEFAARLPAVVAGSILLLWYAAFAWQHPDSGVRRILLWSLFFLTFYPFLILYSQEGRAYSVGVSTLGMAGLLWMLRWRNGGRCWSPPGWAEIALFALACYSHYNAAVLVVLLLTPDAWMAMQQRSGKALLRLLALGCLFLLWIALNAHTILFTSAGGVAYAQKSAQEHFFATLRDAPLALHTYWLQFTAIVLVGLLLVRWRRGQSLWPVRSAINLGVLGGLTLLYLGFAAVVSAKAGMANPRYYIFVLPFVAVFMATVFAQLQGRWLIAGAAVTLAALTLPSIQPGPAPINDDFRGMTLSAVRGSDDATLFLFPWGPNKNMYRIYLERFLGIADARSRMIGISQPEDAGQVCDRLSGSSHIAVVSHDSGKGLIDAVLATCGSKWPQRTRQQFHNTFAEHWIIE